jgi:hypothetical protein
MLANKESRVSEPQPRQPEPMYHTSTSGCVIEHERWEQRKAQAAQLVRRRLLTLREASEHFGLPADEIRHSTH